MVKILKQMINVVVSIAAALTMSCSHGVKEWHPDNERDTFVELKGERVFGNVEFIFPQRLVSIGNILLVQDSNLPGGNLMMSLHTDSLRQPSYHFSQGLGPDEYMNTRIVDYSASDSTLYIFDAVSSIGRLFRINPDSVFFSETNMLAKYNMPSLLNDNHRLSAGFVTDMVTGGKMFTLIDSTGNVLTSFGEYPGDKSGIEASPLVFGMAHQVVMATNNPGDRFAAVGRNSDWMVFYSLSDGTPRLIKEFYSSESPYDVEDWNSDDTETLSVNKNEDSRTYFVDLIPTPDHVYAVYAGSSERERRDGQAHPVTILKLDWDGNLIKGYIMPEVSGAKVVSQDEKYLYAVVPDDTSDNMIIKRYLLP